MQEKISDRAITTTRTGGQVLINMPKIGGGWVTKLINETDLLAGIGQAPLRARNVSGNFTLTVPANSLITMFYVAIHSGSPIIKIGTTLGGNEVLDTTTMTQDIKIEDSIKFTVSGLIYFTTSGGYLDVRVDLITELL